MNRILEKRSANHQIALVEKVFDAVDPKDFSNNTPDNAVDLYQRRINDQWESVVENTLAVHRKDVLEKRRVARHQINSAFILSLGIIKACAKVAPDIKNIGIPLHRSAPYLLGVADPVTDDSVRQTSDVLRAEEFEPVEFETNHFIWTPEAIEVHSAFDPNIVVSPVEAHRQRVARSINALVFDKTVQAVTGVDSPARA